MDIYSRMLNPLSLHLITPSSNTAGLYNENYMLIRQN